MYIAIDVHYREKIAKVVSIEFDQWEDKEPTKINIIDIEGVADYEPGAFYKRELPCILKILKESDLTKVKAIIVDGYVILNDDKKAGLGMYLYNELGKKIPVIGVAKTSFHNNKKYVEAVFRGESKKPIYITSIGTDLVAAAKDIKGMHGDFRMPTLFTILDRNTKD